MSNVFDRIKTKYQEMQRQNDAELEKRRATAHAKSSKIKQLDEQLLKLSLEDMKVAINFSDASKERKRIADDMKKVYRAIEKELIKNGFEANHLSMIYHCDKCNDTGNIDTKTKCDCYKTFVLKERMKDSGLNEGHGSFEAFDSGVFSNKKMDDDKSQREYMQALRKKCLQYASDFPNGASNLILMGKSGIGKTFLIQSVLDRVLKNGHMGKYYTATSLFGLFFKHRMGEAVDLDILMELPLLVIDDLGTEIMTKNVTIEYFYSLISERNIKGLPTVVSTNLNLKNMPIRYGDRIFSRLFSKASFSYMIPDGYGDLRI
jgi:DNA replication protein DnaC